ncbi:MAG: FAD-dependent oxidoreductase [Rubrobacteridae bacterium]|nr:FAD-dependent oxidoreductase [Rubrobacteridae bacterium]
MAVVLKIRKREIGAGTYHRSSEGSHQRPQYAEKTPPCKNACPSNNDIRGFLTAIAQTEDFKRTNDESFEKAWRIVTDTNPIPSIIGRVCPHFCETDCNRQGKDQVVSINQVERFIGDFGIKNNLKHEKLTDEVRKEKVAVVGSGPAGLSCAFQLARRGYPVTIFEAFDKTGGMLRYGIPSYRLPEDILDAEVEAIKALGVDIKCNTKIGEAVSFDDVKKDYDAVYLAIGAHDGWNLGIPGEDGPGIMNAVEFLNKMNGDADIAVGKKVLVIGGGNSAVDAARVSWRKGADVQIVYRRTREEMPAEHEEIEDTLAEGIHIEFLSAPVEIVRDGDKVTGLKCIKMELGEPDASGRRRPVPVEGSEYVIEADMIIPAIGQGPNFVGIEQFNDSGWITADDFGLTGTEGVYAGGDVTNKLGTVTEAIGLGRTAAEAINAYIKGEELPKQYPAPIVNHSKMALNYYVPADRVEKEHISVDARKGNFSEVVSTLSDEKIVEESKRCMSCGMCFDCGNCYQFCSYSAVKKLKEKVEAGDRYEFKLEFCVGCKKCAEECPCNYIDMI